MERDKGIDPTKIKSSSAVKEQEKNDEDASDIAGHGIKSRRVTESIEKEEIDVISPLRVAILGLMLLSTGAAGFYHLPGMIANDAKGSRLVNSIYCSAITLTTVGFGDICPGPTLAPVSKLFIVLFVFSGLGFFCGPLLELTSSWINYVPGGMVTLVSLTIGAGVSLFSNLEGIPQSDAIYASFVVGTTIGYGDYTPKSDIGKLAVAAYAIAVVNVIAGLLKPGRTYLEDLCRVPSYKANKKRTLSSVDDALAKLASAKKMT